MVNEPDLILQPVFRQTV